MMTRAKLAIGAAVTGLVLAACGSVSAPSCGAQGSHAGLISQEHSQQAGVIV
jgi:hypothetical protein